MTKDENMIFNFLFQVKTPIVNTNSKVLVPGLPGHQAPVKGTAQGLEKRKKDADTKEVGTVLMKINKTVAHRFFLLSGDLLVQTLNVFMITKMLAPSVGTGMSHISLMNIE